MRNRDFAIFTALVVIATAYVLKAEALSMPYIIGRTFLRMVAAYLVSLVFSIVIGVYVAHNKNAFNVIFPVLDILQSVPVLGFLPFAVLFIINTIPVFGSEVSTVFLIFTSMTWAIIFNVIEGVRSIPSDIRDAARLNGITGANYLFQIVLPAIYAPVISGSITGWGGGWYFLVAGEYVTFGKLPPYVLPGIGSFIANSAYAGNIIHSLLGMCILAWIVLFMNNFVWGPLLARAGKFGYGQTASGEEYQTSQENRITRSINQLYDRMRTFVMKFLMKPTSMIMDFLGLAPANNIEQSAGLTVYDFAVMAAVIILFLIVFFTSKMTVDNLIMTFSYALKTFFRIFVAYAIAVLWTVSFAVYAARNKKLMRIFMPIFDVAQSIPAIAVFPIIVVFVIKIVGGDTGIELASLLLLLTGTQWYLLFNVIRAIQLLPSDIIEVSSILKLKLMDKLRYILLPAILPTFVIGSMQAIGGAWNATIISEYIQYQDKVYYTPGIGYLLDKAAANGDVAAILLDVLVMIGIIVFLNKFVWKKALRRAELYKF